MSKHVELLTQQAEREIAQYGVMLTDTHASLVAEGIDATHLESEIQEQLETD